MKASPQINHDSFPVSGLPAEQLEFLLEYANLAPSTHNIQPWRFEIDHDRCLVSYDESYHLPENDPTRRDLYISLGCCAENLVLAAREFNLDAAVTYLDDAGSRAIEIKLKPGAKAAALPADTALLDAIVARFNARGLFKKQPVPADFLALLDQLNGDYGQAVRVHPVTQPKLIEELAGLTAEGLRRAYHRPAFRAEIAAWIRPNNSTIPDGLPGYALRMNLPMSLLLPWAMRRFDIGGKLGHINYLSVRSAPLICVYSAPDDTPASWMQIGRLAERVMVEANRQGMKTSIFVASVEIDDLYRQVQQIIGTADRPQFLMVVGYISTPQGHTPRHPVASRLSRRSSQ